MRYKYIFIQTARQTTYLTIFMHADENLIQKKMFHWQYYSLFANGLELLNCVNHVIHLFTKNYSSKYTIDYKERRDLLIIFKSVLVGKGAANCQIFRKLRGIS